MPPANQRVATCTPSGYVDSKDGNTARNGAMAQLANLIPSPSTAGFFVCRPAAIGRAFTGFSSPGYVSAAFTLGTRIYGLVATSRFPGHDEPFCFDTATNSFVAVAGVNAGNVPFSPATSGDWVPPTMDALGPYVLVTHPGFVGTSNKFGWFDMTSFVSANITGTTTAGSNLVTALSTNPLIAGVSQGMVIADGAGNIPFGTTIQSIAVSGTTYTLALSANATGSATGDNLAILGGTAAVPLWAAGDMNQNPLPSVPVAVANFNGRAYFACANATPFSDSLVPLNRTNATQSLTVGGNDPITALAPQPFLSTQQGGVVAALLVFKAAEIQQVTGDVALNTLALNKLVDGVGTVAPRTVVNTPEGVKFKSGDGIRNINLYGQVDPPNPDLTDPFINAVHPSRAAAAYNEGVYRICSSAIVGGVLQTFDRWLDIKRQSWTGPHSLTYDNIVSIGSTFVCTSAAVPATLQQTNVLPGPNDSYNENGVELNFVYETAPLPEGPPMAVQSLLEASLFAQFTAQVNLTANVLDPSRSVLLTYSFLSPFLPPSNPTNWGLLWAQNVTIPTRCAVQLTGVCAQGMGLGSLFMRLNVSNQTNALDPSAITIPSSLDFGSVTDPVLTNVLDWGAVNDSILATVDFEVIGPLPGGP